MCDYFNKTNSEIQKVVFDVFKEADYDFYHRIITTNVDHQFQKAGFDKKFYF